MTLWKIPRWLFVVALLHLLESAGTASIPMKTKMSNEGKLVTETPGDSRYETKGKLGFLDY